MSLPGLVQAERLTHVSLQVHLPLFDPDTLLVLCVFRDPQRKLKSSPPVHVGKLRIRLNALVSSQQYSAALPMLSDRKSGGKRTATAHLQAKVSSSSLTRPLFSPLGSAMAEPPALVLYAISGLLPSPSDQECCL